MNTSILTRLGATLLLSLAACASEADTSESDLKVQKVAISQISSLSYDGSTTKLAVDYQIGGGCAEHRSSVALKLARDQKGSLQVFDETDRGDMCEALLQQSHTAVISGLLSKSIASGSDDRYRTFAITVPPLYLELGDANGRDQNPAPASGSYEVSELGSLSVDANGLMKYGFSTGGGCGTHTTSVVVDLVSGSNDEVTAKISVKHASDDMCEAMIGVEGTADLRKVVAAAFVKKRMDIPYTVKIELPAIEGRILGN